MEMVNVIAAILALALYLLWRIANLLQQIARQLKNYNMQADERHETDKASFWAGIERLERVARRPS